VDISSADSNVVSVPSTVTVPAGATTATFTGLAPWRSTDTFVVVTISMNDVVRNTGVNVRWLQADINRDGIVDLTDYTILATAFNARPGDFNWNSAADLNGDLIIDLTDYTILALQFNLGG
jgi:hypothetical protein